MRDSERVWSPLEKICRHLDMALWRMQKSLSHWKCGKWCWWIRDKNLGSFEITIWIGLPARTLSRKLQSRLVSYLLFKVTQKVPSFPSITFSPVLGMILSEHKKSSEGHNDPVLPPLHFGGEISCWFWCCMETTASCTCVTMYSLSKREAGPIHCESSCLGKLRLWGKIGTVWDSCAWYYTLQLLVQYKQPYARQMPVTWQGIHLNVFHSFDCI